MYGIHCRLTFIAWVRTAHPQCHRFPNRRVDSTLPTGAPRPSARGTPGSLQREHTDRGRQSGLLPVDRAILAGRVKTTSWTLIVKAVDSDRWVGMGGQTRESSCAKLSPFGADPLKSAWRAADGHPNITDSRQRSPAPFGLTSRRGGRHLRSTAEPHAFPWRTSKVPRTPPFHVKRALDWAKAPTLQLRQGATDLWVRYAGTSAPLHGECFSHP